MHVQRYLYVGLNVSVAHSAQYSFATGNTTAQWFQHMRVAWQSLLQLCSGPEKVSVH